VTVHIKIKNLKSGNDEYMWKMDSYAEFHATVIWNAGISYTVLRSVEEDIRQVDAYP